MTHRIQLSECTMVHHDDCLTLQKWHLNTSFKEENEGYEILEKCLREFLFC